MIKISLVIIAFNEAQKIEACIDSAAAVADEVIVVDSYSTDETAILAKNKGAIVLKNKFEGYVEQKNYAMEQAQHDYILSLDADEQLSPELRAEILELKQNWSADGYRMKRLNNYCGKWLRYGGWYPDHQLRLWDRRQGSWEGKKVHEKVVMRSEAKVSMLKGDLLHYTIDSIGQHIQQIERFSSLRAEQMKEDQKAVNYYHLYAKPIFKFWSSYLLKGGIFDGFYGLVMCYNSAYSVFLRYAKLKELYNQENV